MINPIISIRCLLESILRKNVHYILFLNDIIKDANNNNNPKLYFVVDSGNGMYADYKRSEIRIGIKEIENLLKTFIKYCPTDEITYHSTDNTISSELDELLRKIHWDLDTTVAFDRNFFPSCYEINGMTENHKHVFLWAFAHSLLHEFAHLYKQHDTPNITNECEADAMSWKQMSLSNPLGNITDVELGAILSVFSMFSGENDGIHPHPFARLLFLLNKMGKPDNHKYWQLSLQFVSSQKLLSDWDYHEYGSPKEALYNLMDKIDIRDDYNLLCNT